MMDESFLGEPRRRILEALNKAKREELEEKYGLSAEWMDREMPLDAQGEWLDYLLAFEEQHENAETTTVRKRIGNPETKPLAEIPLYNLELVLNELLELLQSHQIAVGFLGKFDDREKYRVITEELLDEEIEDIVIKGMITHFDFSTDEYDVQMNLDFFMLAFLSHAEEELIIHIHHADLYDAEGKLLSIEAFLTQIRAVWESMPAKGLGTAYELYECSIDGDNAEWSGCIRWRTQDESEKIVTQEIDATFHLVRNEYGGWNVQQTTLIEDLLG